MMKAMVSFLILIGVSFSIFSLVKNRLEISTKKTFLLPTYIAEVNKHPVQVSNIHCTKLPIEHPNFAGNLVLIKKQNSTGAIWSIADCKTGKLFPNTFPAGDLYFTQGSNVVIMNPPAPTDTKEVPRAGVYGPPKLIIWSNTHWDVIPSPSPF